MGSATGAMAYLNASPRAVFVRIISRTRTYLSLVGMLTSFFLLPPVVHNTRRLLYLLVPLHRR
jgi:hypothetical protein